jgi:hypothetical protein
VEHAADGARFYPPRLRLLLLGLGCLVAAGICAVPTRADNLFLAGLGWFGVVLLALAVAVLVWRAVRPGPTVVIDAEGLTDRTTIAGHGLVRWEEITVIRKRQIGRGRSAERLLEVVLADPVQFRTRHRGRLGRLLDGYRDLLKHPLVSIPGSMVSAPIQRVADEIRRRRPELLVLEGPPPPPRRAWRAGRGDPQSRGRPQAGRHPGR